MDDTNPAVANPADQILENLDAFAGVVVQILTGGAYPLSSAQTRQLLQAEGALKDSTAQIRVFLAAGDDEDFIANKFVPGDAAFATELELRAQGEADFAAVGGEHALDLPAPATFTDFGRELVGLPDAAALKKLLGVGIDDVDGLAKALKALKPAKATPAPVPEVPEAPPLLEPPAADPAADKPAEA